MIGNLECLYNINHHFKDWLEHVWMPLLQIYLLTVKLLAAQQIIYIKLYRTLISKTFFFKIPWG